MKKFLFLLTFLALAVPQIVGAATVQGTVTDAKSGDTLPGATIRICLSSGEKIENCGVGTITDPDGNYEKEVTDGNYVLTVTSIGYEKQQEKSVSLSGSEPIVKDFSMEPTVKQLAEVGVTASKENVVSWGTGLSAEDLPKYLVGTNRGTKTLKGDATDVTFWLQRFIRKFASFVAALAVLFIVWNGFGIVMASGNADEISKAKKAIMWVVVALLLTIFAYVLVKTVISLVYLA